MRAVSARCKGLRQNRDMIAGENSRDGGAVSFERIVEALQQGVVAAANAHRNIKRVGLRATSWSIVHSRRKSGKPPISSGTSPPMQTCNGGAIERFQRNRLSGLLMALLRGIAVEAAHMGRSP